MFTMLDFPGKKFENIDALNIFLKKREIEKAKLLIIKNLVKTIKVVSIRKILNNNEVSNKK